ncbi:MAG: segregation/condensation protein A, partial [Eubacteriales bacterium]|nr:segregation/condensation protein A [Eubacteriales bacterium]
LGRLHNIFQEVMKKQTDKVDQIRSRFGKIEKEEITVSEKLTQVEAYAMSHKRFSFRELLTKQSSRTQIVVTFLAILEMMKSGKIVIEQEQPFDDILITSQM